VGRVLFGVWEPVAGMSDRTGIHFEPAVGCDDVWLDGSLVGTVWIVPGGWVFYAVGCGIMQRKLPTSVGFSRYDTVMTGLRIAVNPPAIY
jgi:hypothetical protein